MPTGVVADRWVELHQYQCHAVLALFVYSLHSHAAKMSRLRSSTSCSCRRSVATAPERPAHSLLTGRVPACLTGLVWCWHAQLLAPLIDPRVHQLPFAPSEGDFPADLKVSPSYIDTGPTQCQKSSPIIQTTSMSANQNSWMKTFIPTITWMCPPPLKASRSLVTVLICIVVAEHTVEVDPSVPGRVPR